jgi:hypothetical protein
MMRRASAYLAVLGLSALGLMGMATAASAAPTVVFRAAAVPIPINLTKKSGPTYPGTGNILGAGAALETEFKISGTEYGGFPSPLKQVKVLLPPGVKLQTHAFAVCSEAILHASGPAGCPKKSFASPPGEANGFVSFGNERVHEKVSVQGFFLQGGGLIFSVIGTTPVSLEEFSHVSITGGSSGQTVIAEVPLIETVPGALAASAEQINVKVGAAYKQGKKLISYGSLPTKCSKFLSVKAELTFYSGETVPTSFKEPCPKHKK